MKPIYMAGPCPNGCNVMLEHGHIENCGDYWAVLITCPACGGQGTDIVWKEREKLSNTDKQLLESE